MYVCVVCLYMCATLIYMCIHVCVDTHGAYENFNKPYVHTVQSLHVTVRI